MCVKFNICIQFIMEYFITIAKNKFGTLINKLY